MSNVVKIFQFGLSCFMQTANHTNTQYNYFNIDVNFRYIVLIY